VKKIEILLQDVLGVTVSIPRGSVPAIRIADDYIDYAPAIANFLRCGCPAVQMLDVVSSVERAREQTDELVRVLFKLQVGKEKFAVDTRFETKPPVVTIRRATG